MSECHKCQHEEAEHPQGLGCTHVDKIVWTFTGTTDIVECNCKEYR